MISAAASLLRCCSVPEAVFLLFCTGNRSQLVGKGGLVGDEGELMRRRTCPAAAFWAFSRALSRWLPRAMSEVGGLRCGFWVVRE